MEELSSTADSTVTDVEHTEVKTVAVDESPLNHTTEDDLSQAVAVAVVVESATCVNNATVGHHNPSAKGSSSSSSSPYRMTIRKTRKRKLGQSKMPSSSSSESSSSDDDEDETAPLPADSSQKSPAAENSPELQQPDGWRVKLYRLNADGSWDDCGTGRIVCLYRPPPKNNGGAEESTNNHKTTTDQWLYQETGEATLCVQAEVTKQNRAPRVLLRTRILLRDAYQRQGDNIITWCEPFYSRNDNNGGQEQQHEQIHHHQQQQPSQGGTGVDLALSFQDNAGCLDIWRQITHVQARAAELLRQQQLQDGSKNTSVEDMAARVAAQHHADLQRQQHQQNLWSTHHQLAGDEHMIVRNSNDGDMYNNSLMEAIQSLPNPPTLQNLEEIADTIAAFQHVQQREHLALWIAKDECAYLKALLALFPAAEKRGDYGKLATLAACVKTILLLNDPSILELIVSVASIFEEVCSCLEYDPDLREKANHRWFLRERAKFRTVVPMDDPDLVAAIHRSFRVIYIRDTLLRPTMDESSLSTLNSLLTFTHTDVVKGVTMAGSEPDGTLFDSYLIKVIDVLSIELHAVALAEWAELEASPSAIDEQRNDEPRTDPSIVVGKHSLGTTTWKQYLAPQDNSLPSRRLRTRGCLLFLKELFNMVRLSLQQSDKDDFYSVICTIEIDLNEAAREIADNVSQTSQMVEVGSVASTVKSERIDEKLEVQHSSSEMSSPPPPTKLLSMFGSVLGDPNLDVSEKGAVLEIVGGVAMHDPGLIRRHCLEYHAARKTTLETKSKANAVSLRPEPNESRQASFFGPANDILASLLFLLVTETDVGILLQVSEIMRIILDTDVVNDHGPMNAGFADESEGIPPRATQQPHDQHSQPSGNAPTTTDQKHFLSLFYDHYVEWLVAPFQFTILHPVRRVPEQFLLDTSESPLLQRMIAFFQKGVPVDEPLLRRVPVCATRTPFCVELLSFCVRAHLYRMKFFLLKSRIVGDVLKMLRPNLPVRGISGDRCVKLAALRFLRSILSVNDEFYHRHIIQHDLFAPVFEALRDNPVGDNLVSSSIVEMCDFIQNENIKSLIEYIVTKHLSASDPQTTVPSLEDVSGPYVTTLTTLRKAYEDNLNATNKSQSGGGGPRSPGGSRYFSDMPHHHHGRQLSGKALEDQRKFRLVDQEESYFDADDEESGSASNEVAAQEVVERELHRTPRMFSLAQAPLLNNLEASSRSCGKSSEDDKDAPTDEDDAVLDEMVITSDSSGEGEDGVMRI